MLVAAAVAVTETRAARLALAAARITSYRIYRSLEPCSSASGSKDLAVRRTTTETMAATHGSTAQRLLPPASALRAASRASRMEAVPPADLEGLQHQVLVMSRTQVGAVATSRTRTAAPGAALLPGLMAMARRAVIAPLRKAALAVEALTVERLVRQMPQGLSVATAEITATAPGKD